MTNAPRAALFAAFLAALPTSPARAGQLLGPKEDLAHVGPADQTPNTERYEDHALPSPYIAPSVRTTAALAAQSVQQGRPSRNARWQSIGPAVPSVPGLVTYTGRPTVTSGRVTALALSPACRRGACPLLVGAAGGGVWATGDASAPVPAWRPSSTGLTTNAIGSLLFDPTDGDGSTVYAGTGEGNGSSDSEAGVGLFKSVDGGESWALVAGSVPASVDRAIAAVAVDPANRNHLFIGTAVARHGSSSVNGGRYTPPGAPPVGVYESRNGGASFSLAFSLASDVVDPTSPNGSDFFRGGVTKIVLDRTGLWPGQPTRVFVAVMDYGVYRSSPADEGGDGTFKQVFASAGGGTVANSIASRTEFALAPTGRGLRIYVGDAGAGPADFWRTDRGTARASALATGGTNGGWNQLSSDVPGTPGFGSYDFCAGQCTYDMFVESPPGRPDVVWLGGQMLYDEIFTATPPSNGRAVLRSSDGGVHFTDMTDDARSPPAGMHPDQHAIAFLPWNPDAAIVGSDGGVVRTSGDFVNASRQCASRGLAGADLADCRAWLSAVPTRIDTLNAGLDTLQFQSVSLNPADPVDDVIGGTQDNGTWGRDLLGTWFESVGGDGGQSGIDALQPNVRMHTYYAPQTDVNFSGNDPPGWDWTADPLLASGEASSFYVPLIADPVVGGSWFIGLQHVWRTTDSGGPQSFLDPHCNEYTGDFTVECGDWVPVGGPTLTGPAYGADKGTGYVVAIVRARTDASTMWVATRPGRVFVSTNAGAADPAAVAFARVDGPAQPTRFVSGIAVDPSNPFHAWVSFSGYDAYTPTTPGHVFEVRVNPATWTSVWKDLSSNLGDQPVTGLARDDETGDLYAATDFGVALLAAGATSWGPSASGLPPVAVYGLAAHSGARVLYAATHGRGLYRLALP